MIHSSNTAQNWEVEFRPCHIRCFRMYATPRNIMCMPTVFIKSQALWYEHWFKADLLFSPSRKVGFGLFNVWALIAIDGTVLATCQVNRASQDETANCRQQGIMKRSASVRSKTVVPRSSAYDCLLKTIQIRAADWIRAHAIRHWVIYHTVISLIQFTCVRRVFELCICICICMCA